MVYLCATTQSRSFAVKAVDFCRKNIIHFECFGTNGRLVLVLLFVSVVMLTLFLFLSVQV